MREPVGRIDYLQRATWILVTERLYHSGRLHVVQPAVPLRDRPPRKDQLSPRYWGTGGLRKFFMISDSRKAQRDSFARHRATLLFSTRIATVSGPGDWFATTRQGFEPEPLDALQRLKASVRAGIHGFLPIAPAPL